MNANPIIARPSLAVTSRGVDLHAILTDEFLTRDQSIDALHMFMDDTADMDDYVPDGAGNLTLNGAILDTLIMLASAHIDRLENSDPDWHPDGTPRRLLCTRCDAVSDVIRIGTTYPLPMDPTTTYTLACGHVEI